jgi:cytidylate kinase
MEGVLVYGSPQTRKEPLNITKPKVIAIDGREASGKGETSTNVAKRLGFDKLDSGSLYRVFAMLILRENLHEWEVDKIHVLVDREIHRLSIVDGRVHLDGVLVGEEIRTPEIGKFTPRISPIPYLRKALIPLQRACVRENGLVAEGRDMTSVVFPDAQLKIFLTAPEQIRAQRRLEQYRKDGIVITFNDVLKNLRERDHRDETRLDSPLIQVPDAYFVDTGILDQKEVEEMIVGLWKKVSQ